MIHTADPLLFALESRTQSSAEEVAQGLLWSSVHQWACVRVCRCVCLSLCACVCVSFIQWNATPRSSVWSLSKKVWLYLKAWPGRETQTTVCSNISRAAADYYEFYYCLGSDKLQEGTLIKRFTLLSAVGGKNISYHQEVPLIEREWCGVRIGVGCGPLWYTAIKTLIYEYNDPLLLLLLLYCYYFQ